MILVIIMALKSKALIHGPLEQQLKILGENLRTARRRRRWSVEKVRQDICCSKGTLQDAEKGKPTVSLGVYVLLMSLYGFDFDLAALTHPKQDDIGLSMDLSRTQPSASTEPDIDPSSF